MVSLSMQIYHCITAWSPTPPLQKVGEVYKLLQWVKLGILIYTWNFSVRPGRATTSLTMIYCNRFLISSYTGCSLNIVFLSKDFRIFRTLAFLCFPLVSVLCTHTRQVEHQRCSRTGRVQKNHKILRKNTIYNEHPVPYRSVRAECTPDLLFCTT